MALCFQGLKLPNRQGRQDLLLCFQDAGIGAAPTAGREGGKMQLGPLGK
jgi:hypothetical protein